MQSLEQAQMLSSACEKVQDLPGVRFAGVLNKMGNLVAGGFKEDIMPYVEDDVNRKMYMELCLELSMRQEFDEFLGSVEYIAARRKKVTMISIPLQGFLVIISAEPYIDAEKAAKSAMEIFSNSLGA